MDFFFRNLEAAQEQARSLTLTASQSAKGFAQQVTEHTKTIAEQAGTLSSAAAEQASARLKGLQLPDPQQLLRTSGSSEPGHSTAELEQFGITRDFREFIRSLTYSTFRDFPLDQLPPQPQGNNVKYLTPWQEHHALLVVQQVKEINELRFVLCPKRMNDAQFWTVYFTLARKYLPQEAFDPDYKLPEPQQEAHASLDLQGGIQRTLQTANSLAKEWGKRASGSIRPSDTLAEITGITRDANSPLASSSGAAVFHNGAKDGALAAPSGEHGGAKGHDAEADRSHNATDGDLDNDLEAYLQTIAQGDEEGDQERGSNGDDGEFDDYLNELYPDGEVVDVDGSHAADEEPLDLEEYMKEMDQANNHHEHP